MAFFYSATRLFNLFCKRRASSLPGRAMGLYLPLNWWQAAPPAWFRLLPLGSLWRSIPLISSLLSLSLPSLLDSSCNSKGATHFLNQHMPLVGRDTSFSGPSLRGRHQAQLAAQGLGTCSLPHQSCAKVSTVLAAVAPAAPGCAITVASVFHAANGTFPAPSHTQTTRQATARHRHGPGPVHRG